MNETLAYIETILITYAPSVLAALAIFVVGWFLIGMVMRLVKRVMERREVDSTLRKFLVSFISWSLKVFLFIIVIAKLGVETTSFAAVIAALGLAIGLALQGSLSNFAGGVLIILFKPFKAGDFIEAQGESGTVKDIKIFTTTLLSPDSKTIIIPNGALSNGNITNYTTEGKRRVDLTIGIGYGEDIKKAREALLRVMESDPRILKDPAPAVLVVELADSAVNLSVRCYATVADYWAVHCDTLEKSKLALDEVGIEIPFPQRDVHVKEKSS